MTVDHTRGFWLVPTRGRIHTNLRRLLRALEVTETSTRVYVVVDEDDYHDHAEAYDTLGCDLFMVTGGSSGEAFEQARMMLSTFETEWVGFLSDDLVPETKGWDLELLAHLNGTNVISSNDGAHAPRRMNGAVVWSAPLLRAVGYVYPPGLKHMYVDDVWEELGRAIGIWYCEMDVMVRHAHASWGGQKDAITTRANAFLPGDQLTYQAWRRSARVDAVNAITNLLRDFGAEVVIPDLRDYRVLLAVPSGDGTYERVFMRSYVETRDAMRQYGGELLLAEAPYLSDIAMARAKLFGAFLRSDCTHCFWIDADQGWQLRDFLRLLLAGKDFAAAAGVRKVFPPSFAATVSDDHGNAVRVQDVAVDGMLRVTGVGFAFACVTKEWAVRMAQQYEELTFIGAEGAEEHAIFNPMVRNRRYLGEDFAACQRWRDLGGEIFVAPEIDLEHVGKHTWSGAWLDELARAAQRQRQMQSLNLMGLPAVEPEPA